MEKKEQGPIQAHIADKLLYRHWTSYNDGRCNHLILFDTQTKTYKDLTPGNYSLIFVVGGGITYQFSPDSKEICFVSNHDEHQEASTNADLWTVSVNGEKRFASLVKTRHGMVLQPIRPTASISLTACSKYLAMSLIVSVLPSTTVLQGNLLS